MSTNNNDNNTQEPAPAMAPQVVQVSVQPTIAQPVQVATQPSNGLAVASLITGIAGLLLAWFVIGFFSSVAALITGIMGLKKPGGRGMAIAGIITGSIGILISVILFIIGFVVGFIGALV